MAPVLTIPGLDDRPPLLERLLGERSAAPSAPAEATNPASGGGVTLDDLLVGAWEDVTAHRTASCPVCSAEMGPRYGAGPEPVGGRCGGCGSSLS